MLLTTPLPHQCRLLVEEVPPLPRPPRHSQEGGFVLGPELKANCFCIHSSPLSSSFCAGASEQHPALSPSRL